MEILKETNHLDQELSTAHEVEASNSVQQLLSHQLAEANKYTIESFKNSES